MKYFLAIIFAFNTLTAQQWQVTGDMPHPVYGGEAVVKDSMIYIIGGFSELLNRNVNLIQEYDPQSNGWRVVDSINVPRFGLIAGTFSDSIVVVGGLPIDLDLSSSIEMWNLSESPYVYDFSGEFIRTFSTGLIINNILYVFGGASLGLNTSYMFEYNISDSVIDYSSNFDFNLSFPFQQMSANSPGAIYLFGGIFITPSRFIYKYDITNKEIDLLSIELLQSRAGGKAVNVSDSEIYIIGGLNETMPLKTVEIFNGTGEDYNITAGPSLNYARKEFMAVKYDNSIYVFGGRDELGVPVEQVEKLDYMATSTDVTEEQTENINNYRLFQNYPNPFNPSTKINYYLPAKSIVELKVYNISGEEIEVLIKGEFEAGFHQATFHSVDPRTGAQFPNGVYLYRLRAFNFSGQKTFIDTGKMLLLK